jgi:hypothetical protein
VKWLMVLLIGGAMGLGLGMVFDQEYHGTQHTVIQPPVAPVTPTPKPPNLSDYCPVTGWNPATGTCASGGAAIIPPDGVPGGLPVPEPQPVYPSTVPGMLHPGQVLL